MSNISELDWKKCLSCRSCLQICPTNSIEMQENSEGFFYPQINTTCIDCGLCKNHCPIITPVSRKAYNKQYYGLKLRNKANLLQSTSGGVFQGCANYIISQNGIVYGCAYDENLNANIVRIEDIADMSKLYGSKYIASNTQNTFLQVRDDLQSGRNVLYSGTPCQIAGLKSFLRKDYENLYTLDLICHGTPSQKLFTKYIHWNENKLKSKILSCGFRDKKKSRWGRIEKIKLVTKSKSISRVAYCDPYYISFLRADNFKESCYSCNYSNLERVGDLTIGDFWGVQLSYPKVDYSNGLSCCIVNNEQGKKLFEQIKNQFEYFEVNRDEIKEKNPNLNHPTKRPKMRDMFYSGIDEMKGDVFFNKIKRYNYFVFYIRRTIIKLMPTSLIKKIKNNRG